VFFTTDNGTAKKMTARMNGRIVKGGKATLGEPGVRAPFIVNCPGLIPAGVRTDELTDFTDMLPTFAELGSARLPGGVAIDGCSIAKLILGKEKDSFRQLIMAMGFGVAKLAEGRVVGIKQFADRVVRDKQYKLWVLDGRRARLFDLLVQSFPGRDAAPKYDLTPPQPWDKKIKGRKGRK
jgi:arylsulfatase A-like enzyme